LENTNLFESIEEGWVLMEINCDLRNLLEV
jgi:hypothetical protein